MTHSDRHDMMADYIAHNYHYVK